MQKRYAVYRFHAARLLDIQRTYLHQKIAAPEIPKPRRDDGEEE